MIAYDILASKRAGEVLAAEAIAAVVAGAADGSWSDAELAAFLMAAAIRGLDNTETAALTLGMRDSGENWHLGATIPGLCDKHSTGGVGDKLSLVLSPLLAECGVPVAMLTGRALGHTGGTADKLETIAGLDIALDRTRTIASVEKHGFAIGMATGAIAPADRRLYALRSATATVESLQLIVASICSKKLALGASALVFDVKVGSGAFLRDMAQAELLATTLVRTCRDLGIASSALLTDMNQPLGQWSGDRAEVWESIELLAGRGPADAREVTLLLCEELVRLVGASVSRAQLEQALDSGKALERFRHWVEALGGDWVACATSTPVVGPVETVVRASSPGVLATVDTREIGMVLRAACGGGRLDPAVAWRRDVMLGEAVERGDVVGCLFTGRTPSAELVKRLEDAFTVAQHAVAPPLLHRRIG